MKKYLLLPILFSQLSASDIRMADIVLDAIKHCECLKEEGVCNPYVIRINDKNDVQIALNNGFIVNKNLVKCGTQENCVNEAKSLLNIGISNLDMGAYQINYKYHPYEDLNEYFDEKVQREHTNEILTNLVLKFGYSWETLGRYHHFSEIDRTRNVNYYTKMYAFITSQELK